MKSVSLNSPDEPGWHWFKNAEHPDPVMVFVNDEGVGHVFDEDGYSREMEDLKGEWERSEPYEI